ncbi:MAG: AMP-dependent synthetase/ligase [Gammaproteobacteria bacterium]|nr:MAG: AMP-dependent synthetase/ligase [Gammaproteobacteria bacterium]
MDNVNDKIIHYEAARTLDGLFRLRAEKTPDKIAYRYYDKAVKEWKSLTWQQVAEQVSLWQQALLKEDLKPGDRVAIMMHNDPVWCFIDIAALGLKLITVPIFYNDRPENITHILSESSPKLLVIDSCRLWKQLASCRHEFPSLRKIILTQDMTDNDLPELTAADQWLQNEPRPLVISDAAPETLATIVYTSGTTGKPKGVMLSHLNILWNAWASLRRIKTLDDDVFLSFLPLSHMLERTGGYYLPMMAGLEVAYARSIQTLMEDVRIIRPTIMISVPSIYERIYSGISANLGKRSALTRWLIKLGMDAGWRRFNNRQGKFRLNPFFFLSALVSSAVGRPVCEMMGGRFRTAICGGAALSPKIGKFFLSLDLVLLQGYGLTESSPVACINIEDTNDPSSVGPPLSGVEVMIGPDQELLIKSPGVMLGYWNNHSATSEIIDQDGWLHSGDKAEIRNDNLVYITGRIKDILVMSNAENVSPADMETMINLDPMINQSMIIGDGMSFLSAIVVVDESQWLDYATKAGLDPDEDDTVNSEHIKRDVIKRINSHLKSFPKHTKVRRVIIERVPWGVEDGLITHTMKVRRNKLLTKYQKDIDAIYNT